MSHSQKELPVGWCLTTIGDISKKITKGTTPTTIGQSFCEEGVLFVKVESVQEGRIQHHLCNHIDDSTHQALQRSQLQCNDVLFSIAGTIGKVAVVYPEDLPANTNQAFSIIRLVQGVDPRFVQFCLQTDLYRQSEAGRGVGRKNVSLRQIKDLKIPLAPWKEQQRIVAKVDIFFERIRLIRSMLERASEGLLSFRQSVLMAAYKGDLSVKWRKANPTMTKVVENTGLPMGWSWKRAGELFEWSSGKFLSKKMRRKGNVPVYGGNGVLGYHDSANWFSSTIVIGRVGSKCGNVHRSDGDVWITENAIFARFISEEIDIDYALQYLRRMNLRSKARGEGHPFLGQSVLNDIYIPVPSLPEQRYIVSVLAAMFATSTNIEDVLRAMSIDVERVERAILRRAVKGALVVQDANEESAEVFIERIRSTK